MQTLIWRAVIILYGDNITARKEAEAGSKDTKQKKVLVRKLKGSVLSFQTGSFMKIIRSE